MVGNRKMKRQIPPPPDENASDEELDAYFTEYSFCELEAAGYLHELTPEEEEEMKNLSAAVKLKVEARKRQAGHGG